MPISLHVLVCQAQNFNQWCIMVPALQIYKELEHHCPILRDMGNEICVIFVKMKSWQNAKFLESSAPDPFSATTSIPISFDYTVSKRYYVQLQLLLAFHIIKIKRRKMCQFSGIFKDILGQKWENPGGVPYGGHFEFLTKSKVYLRYWCKDLPAHQKLLKSANLACGRFCMVFSETSS